MCEGDKGTLVVIEWKNGRRTITTCYGDSKEEEHENAEMVLKQLNAKDEAVFWWIADIVETNNVV